MNKIRLTSTIEQSAWYIERDGFKYSGIDRRTGEVLFVKGDSILRVHESHMDDLDRARDKVWKVLRDRRMDAAQKSGFSK